MKKYLMVGKIYLSEIFTWRLDFVIWRVRQVIEILVIFFLWNGLFGSRGDLFGYSKEQMMTYLLVSFMVSGFVQGTQTHEITNFLISGEIINFILRPFSIFRYYIARDLADKLVNLTFSIVEVLILVAIFKPPLFIPHDPLTILLFILFILVGTGISFFFNVLLSFTGFWTVETWAPKFIFVILLSYLSGMYFPLDVLPKPIYYLLLATPLPYMQFLPVKIFVKGVDPSVYFALAMSLVWLFVLYKLASYVWKLGLRVYNFYGK